MRDDKEVAEPFDIPGARFQEFETSESSEKIENAVQQIDSAEPDERLHLKEEARLVRRLDRYILPFLFVANGLQLVDKSSLSIAAILGLKEGLHLVKQEFSWTASIFFVGYFVACYPLAWFFVKVPLAKFLSVMIMCWGGVLALHAAANSFASIMVLRAFLGVFESPVMSGFSLVTSMWYTPREHVVRHCVWFSGGPAFGVLGALLGWGILQHDGQTSIPPYKIFFMVLGLVTVVWGIVIWFLLPDAPEKAWFLSPIERSFSALRPKKFQKTSKLEKWNWKQFLEALKDPKCWWFLLTVFTMSIYAGGITTFGGLLLKGIGFNASETMFLLMGQFGTMVVVLIFTTLIQPRIPKSRLFTVALSQSISFSGMALALFRHEKYVRVAGLLISAFSIPTFPILLSLFASNTAGFTKKATTSVFIFVAHCVGNIVGPQFFKASETPRYHTGLMTMMICHGIVALMAFLLRFYLSWENRRRDAMECAHVSAEDLREVDLHTDEGLMEVDQTDWENRHFRYVY